MFSIRRTTCDPRRGPLAASLHWYRQPTVNSLLITFLAFPKFVGDAYYLQGFSVGSKPLTKITDSESSVAGRSQWLKTSIVNMHSPINYLRDGSQATHRFALLAPKCQGETILPQPLDPESITGTVMTAEARLREASDADRAAGGDNNACGACCDYLKLPRPKY